MASRPIETSEDRIGDEAPIWRWVRDHNTAQDFDRNGSVVPPIKNENPYVRAEVSKPEPLPTADHSPVPTLEETWAPRPYEEPESHVAETIYEIEDNLERDDDKGIRLGLLLTRLRMNTIDRAVLSTLDKLGQFSKQLAQEAKPTERNEQGERRLRKRTKVFLGAVAISGVAYASERLGLAHQAQHLVHEAYSDVQGAVTHTHDHSHAANVVHHQVTATNSIHHTQTAAEHTKAVSHQAAHQNHIHHHKAKPEPAIYEFNAAPGDSVTREIQNVGAEHGRHFSAQKAFDIYLNLKHKLRGHIAHRQIMLPNGEIGLPVGHNSLSKEAISLINKYSG